MLDGAIWRGNQTMQQLAWQTAHLMNATGNYKSAVSAADLLGREPVSADPLADVGIAEDTAPDLPTDPTGEKAARAAAMLSQAAIEGAMRDRGEMIEHKEETS